MQLTIFWNGAGKCFWMEDVSSCLGHTKKGDGCEAPVLLPQAGQCAWAAPGVLPDLPGVLVDLGVRRDRVQDSRGVGRVVRCPTHTPGLRTCWGFVPLPPMFTAVVCMQPSCGGLVVRAACLHASSPTIASRACELYVLRSNGSIGARIGWS